MARGWALQEHRRHRDIFHVDRNTVLGIQHDAAIHAFQEDIDIGFPDDILALHTHAFRAMQQDIIVRLDRQTLVDWRRDPMGLRDSHVNCLDAARQTEIRKVRGEVDRTGTRVLHLERFYLRHGGTVW